MDQVVSLFNQLPAALQLLVGVVVLVIVLKFVFDAAVALRARFKGNSNLIVLAFDAVLTAALEGAYHTAQDQLAKLDPTAQKAEIQKIAETVYAGLPDILILHLGKRGVPIPVKLLISQQQFVDLALAVYYKLDQALQELTDELAIAYKKWQDAGSQLPDKPASVGGMNVEIYNKK